MAPATICEEDHKLATVCNLNTLVCDIQKVYRTFQIYFHHWDIFFYVKLYILSFILFHFSS